MILLCHVEALMAPGGIPVLVEYLKSHLEQETPPNAYRKHN